VLRPTLLYGEQDPRLVPSLIHLSEKMYNSLVRFAGSGGRQQITYVGKPGDFTQEFWKYWACWYNINILDMYSLISGLNIGVLQSIKSIIN
jgi:hypothetical protein